MEVTDQEVDELVDEYVDVLEEHGDNGINRENLKLMLKQRTPESLRIYEIIKNQCAYYNFLHQHFTNAMMSGDDGDLVAAIVMDSEQGSQIMQIDMEEISQALADPRHFFVRRRCREACKAEADIPAVQERVDAGQERECVVLCGNVARIKFDCECRYESMCKTCFTDDNFKLECPICHKKVVETVEDLGVAETLERRQIA